MNTSPSHRADERAAFRAKAIAEIYREKMDLGIVGSVPVVSDSMWPVIMSGDRVMLEKAKPEVILADELVVFERRGRFIVHRVVSVDRSSDGAVKIVTRGDALVFCDAPWPAKDLIGKVVGLVRNGEPSSLSGNLESWFRRVLSKMLRIARLARLELAEIILSLNQYSPFQNIFRRYYYFAAWFVSESFASVKGVGSVYLLRSLLSGDFIPGLSDIDLVIVAKPGALETSPSILRVVSRQFRLFRFLFPMLSPPMIFSFAGFVKWVGASGFRSYEVGDWRLMGGEDQRNEDFCNRSIVDEDIDREIRYAADEVERLITLLEEKRVLELWGRESLRKALLDFARWTKLKKEGVDARLVSRYQCDLEFKRDTDLFWQGVGEKLFRLRDWKLLLPEAVSLSKELLGTLNDYQETIHKIGSPDSKQFNRGVDRALSGAISDLALAWKEPSRLIAASKYLSRTIVSSEQNGGEGGSFRDNECFQTTIRLWRSIATDRSSSVRDGDNWSIK